ncbi:hypothetical protein FKM82_008765 [Ascaphus truei]
MSAPVVAHAVSLQRCQCRRSALCSAELPPSAQSQPAELTVSGHAGIPGCLWRSPAASVADLQYPSVCHQQPSKWFLSPERRLLELSTEIKQGENQLLIYMEALQRGCPNLEVLRLLNLVWSPKSGRRCSPEPPGFFELREQCLATSSYSFVSDAVSLRLLRDTPKLRVLDLRVCYRGSPGASVSFPVQTCRACILAYTAALRT